MALLCLGPGLWTELHLTPARSANKLPAHPPYAQVLVATGAVAGPIGEPVAGADELGIGRNTIVRSVLSEIGAAGQQQAGHGR